jgi:hypothetical protein
MGFALLCLPKVIPPLTLRYTQLVKAGLVAARRLLSLDALRAVCRFATSLRFAALPSETK